jgi:hypothetical protein
MKFHDLRPAPVVAATLALALLAFIGLVASAEAVAAPASCAHNAPKTFYVSTSGNDDNAGSVLSPFLTIQRGVDCMTVPGDHLKIAAGTYTEHVTVSKKKALRPHRQYVIEGTLNAQGEPVTILQGSRAVAADGSPVKFHIASPSAPNNEWTPATDTLGEKRGVWISNASFRDSFDRGGFVDPIRRRTVRLISYGRREDLTADNETFEPICIDPAPLIPDKRDGVETLADKDEACKKLKTKDNEKCLRCKRPWTYMGPGVWHDSSGTTPNKVHIRLTPTKNAVPGLFDYNGLSNPNLVPVTISAETDTTLKVGESSYVTIKNMAIRFGGKTVSVGNTSSHIVVDNVRIAAGQYGFYLQSRDNLDEDGVEEAPNKAIKLSNSVVDGSLPDWLFRSDLKDEYILFDGRKNNLARKTAETLLFASCKSQDLTYYNNEFINGHDLNLNGGNVHFHHNLIRNLHDEAMILDGKKLSTGHFHHNVVERSLNAFSFNTSEFLVGPWYIYRNLVDLRQPTAGYRPRNDEAIGDKGVWRVETPFKVNEVGRRHYVFQNTFVVPYEPKFSGGLPGPPFNQYAAKSAFGQEMRFQNNVLAMYNTGGAKAHFMDLPLATISTIRIDGNLYHRVGESATGVFHYWRLDNGVLTDDPFNCEPMEDCSAKWHATDFFIQTKKAANRPPGDESIGRLLVDPKFLSWSGPHKASDDFRLAKQSPAERTSRESGVELEPVLRVKDKSQPPPGTLPDIGLYQAAQQDLAVPLRVGVKQRRYYPRFGGPAPFAPPADPPSLPPASPTVDVCKK